jgi:hypothetical protein
VRLVRITSRELDGLKRRYPRICAQLYRNLSKILGDRLAAITGRVR